MPKSGEPRKHKYTSTKKTDTGGASVIRRGFLNKKLIQNGSGYGTRRDKPALTNQKIVDKKKG